jgi:hypothetical protein
VNERRGKHARARPKKSSKPPVGGAALLARIAYLEEEIDFLKKVRALEEKIRKRERFTLISKAMGKRGTLPASLLCGYAGVSRSGLYSFLTRPERIPTEDELHEEGKQLKRYRRPKMAFERKHGHKEGPED